MASMLPVLLALLSAMLFAIGGHVVNLGFKHLDSRSGTLLAIGSGAILYWMLSPWFISREFWLTSAMLVFAVVGLFRPFVSANLANAGNRILGPTLASTLASTSPFFAVALGIALLGEQLTLPIALGTVAIVAGVMVLTRRSDGVSGVHWPTWALLLPIGAAFFRALGHALSKFGLNELPSPFFASMMTYTVSFALALALHYRHPGAQRTRLRWSGSVWFILSGLINSVSVLSLNLALHLGSVVQVIPVVAASPLFTLLLSVLIFKREHISMRVVVATALVVPGVVMIALLK